MTLGSKYPLFLVLMTNVCQGLLCLGVSVSGSIFKNRQELM